MFRESIHPCRSGVGTANDILGPLLLSMGHGVYACMLTPRIKAATEKSQHEATLAASELGSWLGVSVGQKSIQFFCCKDMYRLGLKILSQWKPTSTIKPCKPVTYGRVFFREMMSNDKNARIRVRKSMPATKPALPVADQWIHRCGRRGLLVPRLHCVLCHEFMDIAA